MAAGCVESDPAGDAGDALPGEDVTVGPDAGLDTGQPDADASPPDALADAEVVDAEPNPYVVELPPTGQTEITSFTNAGLYVAWSENRGDPATLDDVYYFSIFALEEHQVTNRASAQVDPGIHDGEIVYADHQFYNAGAQNFQTEIFHYDITSGIDTRLTNEVSMKAVPKLNDQYLLFLSSDGCSSSTDYNLTLMDRQTLDSTVVAECWQDPASHSISDWYAAWVARPSPGWGKDVFVHDLAAGTTFRIDSTAAGDQYFPHTDDDHVVWQDHRDGRREVYMYTFSTGLEECLTPDGWEQAWPHLRNGVVAWCDYSFSQQFGENADNDIYVYELASGIGRRVTTHSQRWRPRFVDAGWILYARRINGALYKLFVHDLVGDGILSGDGHVLP
jgi:beta propeller repeat protein